MLMCYFPYGCMLMFYFPYGCILTMLLRKQVSLNGQLGLLLSKFVYNQNHPQLTKGSPTISPWLQPLPIFLGMHIV